MLRSSVSGKVKQNQRIGFPSGSPALCFEQLRGARAQIWLTWSLAPAGAPGQSQVNASLVFRHYVVV